MREGINIQCDNSNPLMTFPCVYSTRNHPCDLAFLFWQVLAKGSHFVTFFQLNAGYNIITDSIKSAGGGACNNVDTGTDVQSIRCGPNSPALVAAVDEQAREVFESKEAL